MTVLPRPGWLAPGGRHEPSDGGDDDVCRRHAHHRGAPADDQRVEPADQERPAGGLGGVRVSDLVQGAPSEIPHAAHR